MLLQAAFVARVAEVLRPHAEEVLRRWSNDRGAKKGADKGRSDFSQFPDDFGKLVGAPRVDEGRGG